MTTPLDEWAILPTSITSFRYYITDLTEGQISGTNDETTAKSFATSCDHFVVDTHKVKWLSESGEQEIKNLDTQ